MPETTTITKTQLRGMIEKGVAEIISKRTAPAYIPKAGENGRAPKIDLNTPKGKATAYMRGVHILGAASIKQSAFDYDRASQIAKKWKEETKSDIDDAFVSILKSSDAMKAESFVNGGLFVNVDDMGDVLQYLRAKAIVRNMPGIEFLRFEGGVIEMKRETNDVSAEYVGETKPAAISPKQEYGKDLMTPKKMGARAVVSNNLLRRSSFDFTGRILEKFGGKMSQVEDQHFLRGVGSNYSPKGLLYWALDSNKFNANSTVTKENIDADLNKAAELLYVQDIDFPQLSWLTNPITATYLTSLRDANGILWYPEMENRKLKGKPVFESNNIPRNMGVGSNESEVYYVDGANIVIADELDLITSIDQNPYKDSNGTMRSPADDDETVLRAWASSDFFVRYPSGIVVIQQVKWRAS